jgi:hypothetical protein
MATRRLCSQKINSQVFASFARDTDRDTEKDMDMDMNIFGRKIVDIGYRTAPVLGSSHVGIDLKGYQHEFLSTASFTKT